MSELILHTRELTSLPPPSPFPSAFIYENADCTGDFLELEIADGQTSLEIGIDTLFWDGWNDKGASVMVPDGLLLTLWEHVEPTGWGEPFYGNSNTCVTMPENIRYKMSNLKYEPIPDPAYYATAFVYENADCSGRALPIELQIYGGASQIQWGWFDLMFGKSGWSDKGAAVRVPNGYRLMIGEHDNLMGIEATFYGDEANTCQAMQSNLVNKMSSLKFEPRPPVIQHPPGYIYANDNCTGDSLAIQLAEGQDQLDWNFHYLAYQTNWWRRGASVMVPTDYTLKLWSNPNMGGAFQQFQGQDGVCQTLEWWFQNQMQHLKYFHTPEPEFAGTAVVYQNADCTGQELEVTLDEGQVFKVLDFMTLLFQHGFNDKGASVRVSDGYKLTLWQHHDETGVGEEFYSADNACQNMSGDLHNQMSHLKFEMI